MGFDAESEFSGPPAYLRPGFLSGLAAAPCFPPLVALTSSRFFGVIMAVGTSLISTSRPTRMFFSISPPLMSFEPPPSISVSNLDYNADKSWVIFF